MPKQKKKILGRLKPVANPSFAAVLKLVEEYRAWLESEDYCENRISDWEHRIAETTLEAILGPSFWDWINQRMNREWLNEQVDQGRFEVPSLLSEEEEEMLDWHPMTEAPTRDGEFLVRFRESSRIEVAKFRRFPSGVAWWSANPVLWAELPAAPKLTGEEEDWISVQQRAERD